MSSKFVIGNREKSEWVSVLDTDKKELEFTSFLAKAKEYLQEEDAQINLAEIQLTGYKQKELSSPKLRELFLITIIIRGAKRDRNTT